MARPRIEGTNYKVTRSIRCKEHKGKAKFITPFVGKQIDIAQAFGFEIPEGSGTKYKSR